MLHRIILGIALVIITPASWGTGQTPLSLNFQDIPVKELLRLICQQAHKNITLSEKIEGRISLRLEAIDWQTALETVLKLQGLVKYEQNHVITILTNTEALNLAEQLFEQRIFTLRYLPVDRLAKLLQPTHLLSSQGKISYDLLTNTLIVSDQPEKIARVQHIIQQLDVPTKQIAIEARIVSADAALAHELGLNFNLNPGTVEQNATITAQHSRSLPFNFSISQALDHHQLDLQLIALEKNGRCKIISTPKLLTNEHQTAYIETGSEIPYQEKTKEGDSTVSFKKAVLSLKVTPEIVAQSGIKLDLELSQDKVGQLLINGVPTVETRKIKTEVSVPNRHTIVLGGIYEWSKIQTNTGIPLLKELPLIKAIFSKKSTSLERKELLIFITPKISSTLAATTPD